MTFIPFPPAAYPKRRARLAGPAARAMPPAAVAAPRPAILRFLLALFVASLFFDKVRIIPNEVLRDSVTSLVGYLLAATFVALRLPRIKRLSAPSKLFFAFFAWTAVAEALRWVGGEAAIDNIVSFRYYLQFVQVFALYFICQDLFADPRTARIVVKVFAGGVVAMAIVVLSGFSGVDLEASRGRMGLALLNLNQQAFFLALVLVGIVMRLMNAWPRLGRTGVVLGVSAVPLAIALVGTGSRGGAAVMVFGLVLAAVVSLGRKRIRGVLVVTALMGLLVSGALMRSEVQQARWQKTLEAGDTGFRMELAESGWELLKQSPVIGHGAAYVNALGEMLGRKAIASHNVYLQMALAFGVVGGALWVLALGRTVQEAWGWREWLWGRTMLVLGLMLSLIGVAGSFGHEKLTWVLVAMVGRVGCFSPALEPIKRASSRVRAVVVGQIRPQPAVAEVRGSRRIPG